VKFAIAILFVLISPVAFLAAPAPVVAAGQARVCEANWRDPARNRIIPIRIRMPGGTGRAPLILFSHGLGGNLDAGTIWAEAWAADGNAVVHLQHPGSDSAIIGSGRVGRAISMEQLRARALDVKFVIDEVARRPREGACDLGLLDLGRIGMAGHSFGAQTTLATAGQAYALDGVRLADPRVKAAVAFSPQPAFAQRDEAAFGGITIPFLSITGTEDVLPWLSQVTAKDRERPFRAMAPGDKFLLVMDGANHRMFSGQDNIPLVDSAPTLHVREVVARATTLFWRAVLRGDHAARRQLADVGASLLSGDRFEQR
jgi:predicted dienelactone hydrolase